MVRSLGADASCAVDGGWPPLVWMLLLGVIALPAVPRSAFRALLCYVSAYHPAPCAPVSVCRHLHIPLVQAERAWAYAMDLKGQLEQQMEAQVGPEGVCVTEECSIASARWGGTPLLVPASQQPVEALVGMLGHALLPTVQAARPDAAAAALLPEKCRLPARLPNHPPAHRSGST